MKSRSALFVVGALAAFFSLVQLAGCAPSESAKKKVDNVNAPTTEAPVKEPATAKAEPVAADDPEAVSAIEKIGGAVTRNAAGNVTAVDLSKANVKDFDYSVLKKLPSLTSLELYGVDVNDATLDKLAGLPLQTLILENTEITDAATAKLEALPKLKSINLRR